MRTEPTGRDQCPSGGVVPPVGQRLASGRLAGAVLDADERTVRDGHEPLLGGAVGPQRTVDLVGDHARGGPRRILRVDAAGGAQLGDRLVVPRGRRAGLMEAASRPRTDRRRSGCTRQPGRPRATRPVALRRHGRRSRWLGPCPRRSVKSRPRRPCRSNRPCQPRPSNRFGRRRRPHDLQRLRSGAPRFHFLPSCRHRCRARLPGCSYSPPPPGRPSTRHRHRGRATRSATDARPTVCGSA